MSTIMKISSRNLSSIRRRSLVKGGMAGILASGLAPTFARAEPKKLVMAHLNAVPESAAVAFDWQAAEVRKRSNGELDMQFFGGTLLSKELEIMNAVKSGNIAIGNPGGAAATVFPEMGVFLVPYLVQSYDQAYKMFNGKIGDTLDKQFQEKYKLKTLCFFDYGFRHFWTQQEGDQRAQGPARRQDPRAAGQGVRRHDQWARRQCRADGLGRGDLGRQVGRDRRRRPADRQPDRAQDLRGLEILLDDLPQLRADAQHHEPRGVGGPERAAQEADARHQPRGAGQVPRAHRDRSTISPPPRRSSSPRA